jgi:hypothetical protein
MASITIDRKAKTLRTDSLKDLGVTIRDINLKCNVCGFEYLLPVPWENGNFVRSWFECPRGCNKVKASKTPAAA